jgi:hypothetical protein
MERFQHRWVDEFLLSRMTMTDLVAIPGAAPSEAAAAAPSDGPRLRNLAAFLYEILRAQNGELSELGDSYADARALIAARLEEIGADGPA